MNCFKLIIIIKNFFIGHKMNNKLVGDDLQMVCLPKGSLFNNSMHVEKKTKEAKFIKRTLTKHFFFS